MLEKRIGVIMYQTSNSQGQELIAQRMVRDFNRLGQKAFLITGTYHDGKEVAPREALLKNKGYYCVKDEALDIPVIRVESTLSRWPPRRVMFKDFVSTLNGIVDDFNLNVLITHGTLWNGPEETAKFVAWRRDMKDLGGYSDPMVFCHMSHSQEPSSQKLSIPELTFRSAWNKVSLTKILETADRVLVVNPLEKKAKIEMGVRPEKCFLYPGGIDSEAFLKSAAEETADFRLKHCLAPGVSVVSYLGTLEEGKNPLAVLKVAERLKDKPYIHFMLAGGSNSACGAEVVRLAKSLPNVTYLGELEDREKLLLIKASHLNLWLCREEPPGITQLECMYCGVPVIIAGEEEQSWLLQDGVEGIHIKEPEDIEEVARAVTHLVEDRGFYRTMSSNAREKARKFSSIHLAGELDSAISEDLIRQSGLHKIPHEMSQTLTKTEYAIKSWSYGTSRIVATNRRLFIKKGIVSQSVVGVRYYNIRSIEYLRKFPWKIPLAGALISGLASFIPNLSDILAPGIVEKLSLLSGGVIGGMPSQNPLNPWLLVFLPFLPFIISLLVFFSRIKTGFNLHGIETGPIYLPGSYKQVIEFIRRMQDKKDESSGASEKGALEALIDLNNPSA